MVVHWAKFFSHNSHLRCFEMDSSQQGAPTIPERRRALSHPQFNPENDSVAYSELRNFVTESQELQQVTVPIRHVNPSLATSLVLHPTVFSDISSAPTLPTAWNSDPQFMTCPNCHITDLSVTESRISGTNFFYSGLCFMTAGLCLLGMCCPCCMDTAHICRHCEEEVGYRSAV